MSAKMAVRMSIFTIMEEEDSSDNESWEITHAFKLKFNICIYDIKERVCKYIVIRL